jgi:hypothetical protein
MPDDPVHLPIEREIDLHAFAPRDIPSVVQGTSTPPPTRACAKCG